jgi:two-component system NtrC family response regulator
MTRILVIDHDISFMEKLNRELTRRGYDAEWAHTLARGTEAVLAGQFELVCLNARMADGKGLDALPGIMEAESSPEVIVISDVGDADEAETAIKSGAWDYIKKPPKVSTLVHFLMRVLQYRAGKAVKRPTSLLKKETFTNIVGSSPQIRICLETLALAANSDAHALITGETGSGKELFAWAIHNNSARADRKFVVVDCAALPETLVESTLFGFEKGSFTGADRSQEGLIKQADGGTLFLDEVGEMPISTQKSFLRVLQERRFRPIGSQSEVESDFRLIAASNRNLDTMVRKRRFRKDLLFRLRAFSIELPPLRERPGDIQEIGTQQVARLCASYGIEKKGYSADFFEVLAKYDWPGNVRELINALERAVAAARNEPVLFPRHLPTYLRARMARTALERGTSGAPNPFAAMKAGRVTRFAEIRRYAVAQAEYRYLKELMAIATNVDEACHMSGLSRSRLYSLLKTHGVESFKRPQFSSQPRGICPELSD